MLQNFRLIEMTAHLDREVIPKRRCTPRAAAPTVVLRHPPHHGNVLSRTGHLSMLESPAELSRIIAEFIARCDCQQIPPRPSTGDRL